MAATNGIDRVSPRAGWAREIAFWLRRYAPAEVAATLGAVLAAGAANRFGGVGASALAGTVGEAVAFYGYLYIRGLRCWPERPPADRCWQGRRRPDLLLARHRGIAAAHRAPRRSRSATFA
jgi:hypothetical protein